ncbi:S66 peptidase family protein [Virgibacillus kimchii]
MILPERLKKGDTIGIIAPSGPIDTDKLKKAVPFFEEMGLHVKLGKYISHVNGYLAGTDEERLTDLHAMLADDTVKAIIFARGGYGAGRIVSSIDYSLVKNNPKIIWGYSDITYLHTAIRQKAGLITFHGPMAVSDVAKDDFDELSAKLFKQLFQPADLIYTEKISPIDVLVSGESEGELIGGNLSLIASTIGTPFEIDTKDKLLLLEDIGEEPYRIDSMLNQLKLAGKLEAAAGVILGDFAETESDLKTTLSVSEVFSDYFGGLNCPVMSGFKIGHCFPHFSVPLGTKAVMSTKEKTLKIAPGVK